MKIDDLIGHGSEWLKAAGPKSDIVISTRIRIARNISGEFFCNRANIAQSAATLAKALTALKKSKFLKNAIFVEMKETVRLDREFLIERHLMSKEHAMNVKNKALIVDPDGIISIMLNEEDHLRIQVLQSGFNITEAWRIMSELETDLTKHLSFACSNDFGYLTSCPTNTGTGLRASVMLHLPALQMTEQIENVYEAISKLGLTIRGFYGEGSEASGNFFQISNQVALGHSELDIIDNLERVINKIIDREEETRKYLLRNKKEEISDSVFRSYGTLKNARIITSREAIKLLSTVRLGIDLGLIRNIDKVAFNETLQLMQPAHLQKINKSELSPQERDIRRADLIRERLKGSSAAEGSDGAD